MGERVHLSSALLIKQETQSQNHEVNNVKEAHPAAGTIISK
jgi:hypothetical protein